MPGPNAGHELMRRFTSRTQRLLRDKPKYGSLRRMSWTQSKAAMFSEHEINNVPQVLRPSQGEDPVTDNNQTYDKPHRPEEQDDRLVPRGFFPNLNLKASGTTPSPCSSHLMASGTKPNPCIPNYFRALYSFSGSLSRTVSRIFDVAGIIHRST
ncbi:hypothetical protein PIB30_037272 [Stylosanthes scabra]|uniref:Uncharacterized protein n=1 Tax=Stylosanthes scabra TaxID=79078 RepID=A0ABU6VFJ4_9FABA|nr:hypothetical protein [Stylosanthes scabra]